MCASWLTDSCVFCTFFKMPLDFLGMHNFKPCKCWVNSTPADSTIRAYSRPQVLSHTCSPVHLLDNRPATISLPVQSEKSKICKFIHGKSAFLPLCLKKAKFSSFWKKISSKQASYTYSLCPFWKSKKTSFFSKIIYEKMTLLPLCPCWKKSKFSSLKIIIKEKLKLTLILLFGGQFNFKIFVAYVFWFQSWLKLNSKFDLENSCLGRLNGGARFPQTSQMFTSGAFSDIGYGGSVGFCWSGFRGKQNELTLYEQGKRDLKISVDFLRFY